MGDHSGSHILYIPFIRTTGDGDTRDDQLWIARSTDGATTWTRVRVADLGHHAADNIFPQLALDRSGNNTMLVAWAIFTTQFRPAQASAPSVPAA